ncbi:MAG: hypothetical protein GEU98_27365 [Pseudonocardiaceae bacterium]|nr:hypothetical protein [Pseudonocardiaceae bacterium]
MRSNNLRRSSLVAGVALISALGFGSVAQASTAGATPEPASASAETQAKTIKAKGQIEKVSTKVVHGKKITGFTLAAKPDMRWLAGDKTSVIKDGKPASAEDLEKGDNVLVTGKLVKTPHGTVVHAEEIVARG